MASTTSVNDVLLHPDALHCLKRKQLENLCIRLNLKSTGKKDELIARLEGYACGKVALDSAPSTGTLVLARTRSSASVLTLQSSNSGVNGEDPMEMEVTVDADTDNEVLAEAGPSIRLITRAEGEENGVGEVSRSSSRTFVKDDEKIIAPAPSAPPHSIYPWKRISSTSSISRLARSISSSSIPASSDDNAMKLDEFGGTGLRKSSTNSLKRWLSKSSSASSIAHKKQKSEAPSPTPAPLLIASPASKRKRNDEEEFSSLAASTESLPEEPVRRAIKARPSRRVKADVSSPVPQATPTSPTSISQADFSEAANKVLEEMNARLLQNGKPSMVKVPSQGAWSVSAPLKPPASPLKSINSRTKGRFSGEHAKQFCQMDSIANHYAAKRLELANKEWNASASTAVSSSKRIKIADENSEEKVKRGEDRAAIQRKLEMSKQRRKSVGRRVSTGRKSVGVVVAPRTGFKSKISGAVRDFVGAAKVMASGEGRSNLMADDMARQTKPTLTQSITTDTPRTASNGSSMKGSKVKPKFDLKASLARKPVGYTPYSAKETVQLLQTASVVSSSPIKTGNVATPSPIRSGWTMVAPTAKGNSSTIAFPLVSPSDGFSKHSESSLISTPIEQKKPLPLLPSTRRTNTTQQSPAKKTRSSISNARQGTMQADRLKRAARANEMKHQTTMAAQRRNGAAVQRAVERGEKVVKVAMTNGTGRGSPRKSSGRLLMGGEGRGAAALKSFS